MAILATIAGMALVLLVLWEGFETIVLPGKQEMMCGSKADFELTEPVFSGYEHCLSRFIAEIIDNWLI